VTDACVVDVPDQYSGEVPVAFVVLSGEALTRVQSGEKEMKKTKISILKVRSPSPRACIYRLMEMFAARRGCESELQMDRGRRRDRGFLPSDPSRASESSVAEDPSARGSRAWDQEDLHLSDTFVALSASPYVPGRTCIVYPILSYPISHSIILIYISIVILPSSGGSFCPRIMRTERWFLRPRCVVWTGRAYVRYFRADGRPLTLKFPIQVVHLHGSW
jgi:hypothetical protein